MQPDRIEKLKRRDNILSEIYKRRDNRQKQIDLDKARALQIQRNNVRLVKKIFVDMYVKGYVQNELLQKEGICPNNTKS